jgi:hypothetical protein
MIVDKGELSVSEQKLKTKEKSIKQHKNIEEKS